MVRGWFTVRVDLVSGPYLPPGAPPGRIMLVGPHHTLRDLAEAIDLAFARWDLAHLHEFRLPDGRRYGIPDDDLGIEVKEHKLVRAGRALSKGEPFTYVFDFGDDWRHECRVEHTNVDPVRLAGIVPARPIPIWGWGWIPDQYDRHWYGDDGSERSHCPLCGSPRPEP